MKIEEHENEEEEEEEEEEEKEEEEEEEEERQQQQHQFNDGFSTVQQLADALLWTQPCPCQKQYLSETFFVSQQCFPCWAKREIFVSSAMFLEHCVLIWKSFWSAEMQSHKHVLPWYQ